MGLRAAIVVLAFTVLFSCSTSQKAAEQEQTSGAADMVGLVLKNFDPDFRFCFQDAGAQAQEYAYSIEFVMLPSGNTYDSRFTPRDAVSSRYTACIKKIFDRIVFPPVKDKKAKILKRELVFR